MPQTPEAFEARAEECVKCANSTTDEVFQADLLKLRQRYLEIARRLGNPSSEIAMTRARDTD